LFVSDLSDTVDAMAARTSQANQRNATLLAGVGHFTARFFELMFPILAVQMTRELHLPLAEVLRWSFLGYLLLGLGALPAAVIADRFGARRVLLIGLAGIGVSALAAAEAAPGRGLSVCLASLGLSASCCYPAGMCLVAHTRSRQRRASAVQSIFGNLAIALTPLLTIVLMDQFGTRHAFQVAGLVVCGLAAALGFLHVDESWTPQAATSDSTLDLSSLPNRGLLFAILCGCAMLAGISYRGFTLVAPTYFAERVSLLHFGAVTALVYAVGVVGHYVGSRLTDRYELRMLYLALHASSLPLLLLMSRTAGVPLVLMAMPFALISFGMQPIEATLFARFAPPRWHVMGSGLQRALTFGAGSLAMWLVPWMKPGSDLSAMFVYLAGVVGALIVAIAIFVTASAGERVRNLPADAKVPVGEPAV
jgi:MFS family permease